MIARAWWPTEIEVLDSERAPVRLGHNVFAHGWTTGKTIADATRAFRAFRRAMDHHEVEVYRAVATSAVREARNRLELVRRVRRKASVKLEIISEREEARLVRVAVLHTLGNRLLPRLILDLGGGSLELNFLNGHTAESSHTLPLGAVRLMETYRAQGAISEELEDDLRRHVDAVLRTLLGERRNLAGEIAAGCGGNVEYFAGFAPGPGLGGVASLNLGLLRDRLWEALRLDVAGRMQAYGVRRDRAEVMGVAGIVLVTLARWLNLRTLLVPRVGVREGILLDLAKAACAPAAAKPAERRQGAQLLESVRKWAQRFGCAEKHAEQVRRLATMLFDELYPLHRMGPEQRLLLELAALVHDAGEVVNRTGHHRHGEYLLHHAEIPGLGGWQREIVACLVRYHNGKSEPQPGHELYAALQSRQRRQVRALAALLRMAEKLDSGRRQTVQGIEAALGRGEVVFHVHARAGAQLNLAGLRRRAALLEREFAVRAVFRRAESRRKVA